MILSDDFIIESIPDNKDFDERTKMLWFGRFIERAVLAKASQQDPVAHAEYQGCLSGVNVRMLASAPKEFTGYLYAHPAPPQAVPKQEPYVWLWVHANGKCAGSVFGSEQDAIDSWAIMSNGGRAVAAYIAQPPQSAAIPEGYALVPLEPSTEQQTAGAQAVRIDTTAINKLFTANRVYREMIAAAPKQEGA